MFQVPILPRASQSTDPVHARRLLRVIIMILFLLKLMPTIKSIFFLHRLCFILLVSVGGCGLCLTSESPSSLRLEQHHVVCSKRGSPTKTHSVSSTWGRNPSRRADKDQRTTGADRGHETRWQVLIRKPHTTKEEPLRKGDYQTYGWSGIIRPHFVSQ